MIDNLTNLGLVLEPLDILAAVSIALLQDLDKLLVHAIGHGEHTAADAERLALVLAEILLLVADALVELDRLVLHEHADDLLQVLETLGPHLGLHAVGHARVVVERDGDQVEHDLDVHGRAQVVLLANRAQLFDHLDLLVPVRAFASAARTDLVEFVHHRRVIDLVVFAEQFLFLLFLDLNHYRFSDFANFFNI